MISSKYFLNFIFLWLCWVFCCFKQAFCSCGGWGLLSSCRAQASHGGGFSCCRAQALRRTDFGTVRRGSVVAAHRRYRVGSAVAAQRRYIAGSVAVMHGLNCPTPCGILPDQGLNLCPVHWHEGSLSQGHQGSLPLSIFESSCKFSPSELILLYINKNIIDIIFYIHHAE